MNIANEINNVLQEAKQLLNSVSIKLQNRIYKLSLIWENQGFPYRGESPTTSRKFSHPPQVDSPPPPNFYWTSGLGRKCPIK